MNKRLPYYLFLLLVILIFLGCVSTKKIRFLQNGKTVDKYKVNLIERKLSLEIEGIYVTFGSGFEIGIRMDIENRGKISGLGFKIENVILSFNNNIVPWNYPQMDSSSFKVSKSNYYFFKQFRSKDIPGLYKEDIDFLINTEFPLKISFDNFIFVNDTAVKIDTVYVTSPYGKR